MSTDEKKTIKRLCEAIEALPDAKKEWILGYAEGVADSRPKDESEAKQPA